MGWGMRKRKRDKESRKEVSRGEERVQMTGGKTLGAEKEMSKAQCGR